VIKNIPLGTHEYPYREKRYDDEIMEGTSKIIHYLNHFFPTYYKNRFQRNLDDLASDPNRQVSLLQNLFEKNPDYPLIFNDRAKEPFLSAVKTSSGDTQRDGEFVQQFLREIKTRHSSSRCLAKIIDPEKNYHPLHFFAERSKKSGDIWHKLSEDLMDFVENWAEFIGINNPWPHELTENHALRKLYANNLTSCLKSKLAGLSLVETTNRRQRQTEPG